VIACGIARPLNAESSCFVLVVIVSSLFGGRGPGLLAVRFSAIAFDVFFLASPSGAIEFPIVLFALRRVSHGSGGCEPID
jgi:hypothetical protein